MNKWVELCLWLLGFVALTVSATGLVDLSLGSSIHMPAGMP